MNLKCIYEGCSLSISVMIPISILPKLITNYYISGFSLLNGLSLLNDTHLSLYSQRNSRSSFIEAADEHLVLVCFRI